MIHKPEGSVTLCGLCSQSRDVNQTGAKTEVNRSLIGCIMSCSTLNLIHRQKNNNQKHENQFKRQNKENKSDC